MSLPDTLWYRHDDCPYFRDKEGEAQEAMSPAEGHPAELGFKPTSAWLRSPGTQGVGQWGRHGNLSLRACHPRTSRHVAHLSKSLSPVTSDQGTEAGG